MKSETVKKARERAAEYYKAAKIALTADELANIEVADFGLGMLDKIGLELVVYVNNGKYCGKEMALFPGQICPEHIHSPIPEKNYPGKQETFRCRYGEVELFLPGDGEKFVPLPDEKERSEYFTVFHRILLTPGEQYTIAPGTLHWFRSGKNGAVVSEFSTPSFDEYDIFTDPEINRLPTVDD